MKRAITLVLTIAIFVSVVVFGVSAEETNIALGKSYTYTGQFYDPHYGELYYGDRVPGKLTDGIIGGKEDIGYASPIWIGMNWNGEGTYCEEDFWSGNKYAINYITLDFDSIEEKLTRFVLYAEECDGGVERLKMVNVYISDDNITYRKIGTAAESLKVSAGGGWYESNYSDYSHYESSYYVSNYSDYSHYESSYYVSEYSYYDEYESEDNDDNTGINYFEPEYGIYAYTLSLTGAVDARYVKFEIYQGPWAFVSEIEVYQNPDATPAPPPREYDYGVNNFSDAEQIEVTGDLSVLRDGDKYLSGVFFRNKVCTDGEQNPTVDLVLKLDEIISVDSIVLNFALDKTNNTALPRYNEVRLSYSTDGYNFIYLGAYYITGYEEGEDIVEAVFDLQNIQAQYIEIEFDFGENPFAADEKVIYEYMALTEIQVIETGSVEMYYSFDILNVDESIVAENGIIFTSKAALESANAQWSVLIHCEKIAGNMYRVKSDAYQALGFLPDIDFKPGDIVIAIHSATSNPDLSNEYPNVLQRLAALEVEEGMLVALEGINLSEKTSENGKATVYLSTPYSTGVPENTHVFINYTRNMPNVDGVVQPGEYGPRIHSIDYSSGEFISAYDEDMSVRADFYMTWSDESLNLAWVVHTDNHWPISYYEDLGYMYMYSCVQFMLCKGAPDVSRPYYYQTSEWSGNYLEAGLSIMEEGYSEKVMWSLPHDVWYISYYDWDFYGSRNKLNNTTTYEVALPWHSLGIYDIYNGYQLGLTYAIGDQNADQFLAGVPNMAEWQDAILGGKNMDAGAVITLVGRDAVDRTQISGTLSIIQAEEYSELLIADTSGVYPSDASLMYQWYRNGQPITYADSDFYVLNHADMGKSITVEVYGYGDYFGSITSEAFLTEKLPQTAPPSPALIYKTEDSVKLWYYDCAEYRLEDGEWQDSNVFTDLTPGETYNFYVRNKESTQYAPSPESDPLTVVLDGSHIRLEYIENVGYYLFGFADNMTADDIISVMGSNTQVKDADGNIITDDTPIGTGAFLSCFGEDYSIIIKGDITGDGVINAKDYVAVKRAFLGTYTLDSSQLKAACIEGGESPTAGDYVKIKRHFLGTYDLHK